MARTINEEEYAARRNEILDVTLRLIYTKGYERMTVQDVMEALKISKGAFYHYFKSKQDMMEGAIERMIEEAIRVLTPVVEDPRMPALEKMQCYFNSAAQWKTARIPEMRALLRMWYADENAIVRQKVIAATSTWFTPMITKIVHQGVREGVFHTPYPDLVGQIFVSMVQGFGDNFVLAFIDPSPAALPEVMDMINSFSDAIERILGAPEGSLKLMDEEMMKEWLEPDAAQNSHR